MMKTLERLGFAAPADDEAVLTTARQFALAVAGGLLASGGVALWLFT